MDTKNKIYRDLLKACKMSADYINKELGNDIPVLGSAPSTIYGVEFDLHFLEEVIDRADYYKEDL